MTSSASSSIVKIGLVVTVNKISDSLTYTFSCNNIDECYNELINCLANEFKIVQFDYPQTYEMFQLFWFDKLFKDINEFNYECFTYTIFNNNEWIKPWDNDDIYNDLLDKLIDIENENPECELYEFSGSDNEDNKYKYKDMDKY